MKTLKEELDSRVAAYDLWAQRRRHGQDGHNNRKLWVLGCMDERLPINEALGIQVDTPAGGGDAHCFRNAGGIVTDDAIRSAMLTCNFFGTKEIVIVQHTQCGMLSANAADLEKTLRGKGIDPDKIALDPTLPELKLEKGAFAKWIGMMDDVDEACMRTIEAFKNHPLIPKDVVISGWVWEVETRRLRAPTLDAERRARTHFARALGAARSGDTVAAEKDVQELARLREALKADKNEYWATEVEVSRLGAAAWTALADGKREEALRLMHSAADMEDKNEKHIVTPGRLVPARELLGEMLLVLKRPAEALKEFEVSHIREPERFHGYYGAAQAAAQSGDKVKAKHYFEHLVKIAGLNSARSELTQARAFLSANP